MYLMSTEKQVRSANERIPKARQSTVASVSQCQKCFQTGHWTYKGKNERVYISRPSRMQQLKNPKLRMKISISYELDDNLDFLKEEMSEKREKRSKRKHKSDTDSDKNSEASVFESESGESSVTGLDESSRESELSYSSSTDSEEERRRKRKNKKRKQKKRRQRRYSSSSESSESYSDSDSDSDNNKSSRRKGKKQEAWKKALRWQGKIGVLVV